MTDYKNTLNLPKTDFPMRANLASSVWTFPYFHHAAYSSGEHGNDDDMHWDWASHGVQLVFAGHDHNYERFHPSIGGFGRPRTITPLPQAEGHRGEAEGVGSRLFAISHGSSKACAMARQQPHPAACPHECLPT